MDSEPKKLLLTSPIPESVNHYFRYRAFIKDGKARAMGYKTQSANAYEQEFISYVREQASAQCWEMSESKYQHYYVDATFYFQRTDKDPNNYWKILLDSITRSGVVWLDDNVVCERVNRICYDSEHPRIELEIYAVDYIGVFDSDEHLNCFLERCKNCRRYKNNCSILRKAKEGRIQPEITGGCCSAYKELKEKMK